MQARGVAVRGGCRVAAFVVGCWLLIARQDATAWLFSTPSRRTMTTGAVRIRSTTAVTLAPQQLGEFEALETGDMVDCVDRRVRLVDWLSNGDDDGTRLVDFSEGWDKQRDLWQTQADRLAHVKPGGESSSSSDAILMLQHAPVYTLGTASDEGFIKEKNDGTNGSNIIIPTIRMNRGGEVTYHGPGQLVVYPVLDLRNYRCDIHWYMRALEEAVLVALTKVGVTGASRETDTTGVWVDQCKVAAVGVHARRWITQHGVAVNVEARSLDGFAGIVPCGLEGRKVACVNQFLREPITVATFALSMQAALEEVFQMQLVYEEGNDGHD
jgi:lipoyl(octanoyl) transferase